MNNLSRAVVNDPPLAPVQFYLNHDKTLRLIFEFDAALGGPTELDLNFENPGMPFTDNAMRMAFRFFLGENSEVAAQKEFANVPDESATGLTH